MIAIPQISEKEYENLMSLRDSYSWASTTPGGEPLLLQS
jgi:hypothetical protein